MISGAERAAPAARACGAAAVEPGAAAAIGLRARLVVLLAAVAMTLPLLLFGAPGLGEKIYRAGDALEHKKDRKSAVRR